MNAPERRHYPRIKARGVAAQVRGDHGEVFSCLVDNLSEGGLFVRSENLLQKGTAVSIDLVRAGESKAVRLYGVVAGVATEGPHGFGVEFGETSSDQRARLFLLLHQLGLPTPPPPTQAPTTLTPPAPASQLLQAAGLIDGTRLMMQIKGLLLELGETQQRLHEREQEIEQLRLELAAARALPGSQHQPSPSSSS